MNQADSGFSRRNFFHKAGAAAATGFTIVRPEAVRGSQANSKISVGLIGVGGRGSFDAGVFNTDPRARITALCDLFDDRIETGIQKIKLDKPAVYKDFEKLLASNSIDAVLIATPPSRRRSISIARSRWASTWRACSSRSARRASTIRRRTSPSASSSA